MAFLFKLSWLPTFARLWGIITLAYSEAGICDKMLLRAAGQTNFIFCYSQRLFLSGKNAALNTSTFYRIGQKALDKNVQTKNFTDRQFFWKWEEFLFSKSLEDECHVSDWLVQQTSSERNSIVWWLSFSVSWNFIAKKMQAWSGVL